MQIRSIPSTKVPFLFALYSCCVLAGMAVLLAFLAARTSLRRMAIAGSDMTFSNSWSLRIRSRMSFNSIPATASPLLYSQDRWLIKESQEAVALKTKELQNKFFPFHHSCVMGIIHL